MLNEGYVTTDVKSSVKSEMVKQLRLKDRTTPDQWERSVFKSLVGYDREEVDWEFEDNQAGYYTWLRSFDGLVNELVEDGYVRIEESNGVPFLIATDPDLVGSWPGMDVTRFAPGA